MDAETSSDKFSFIVDWFDPTAGISRKFGLFYYPTDNGVEMIDLKARRMFLKRTPINIIKLADFHIGATIVVLSRMLKIVDFADDLTRAHLSSTSEKTVGIVLNDGMSSVGTIIDSIYNSLGLILTRARMVDFTEDMARQFAQGAVGIQNMTLAEKFMCGRVLILEMMGADAMRKWRDFLGLALANDSSTCHAVPPTIGSAKLASICYGSDSPQAYERDRRLFQCRLSSSALFKMSTCCIIKPHAIKEKNAGKILTAILDAGFQITAMEMYHIELVNAEEFYEVYKGVVSEYKEMVLELASGPCLALEIVSSCDNTPKVFRDFAGPSDPALARQLRQTTLRARFGVDKVHNGIHCTDIPEDAMIESEYLFKVLQ